MEINITIQTGLNGFRMLDRITGVQSSVLIAEKTIQSPETKGFTGIEILAQAGALHVRYLLDFKRHAFLLGIRSYEGPSCPEPGRYTVTAVCRNRSRDAFEYDLEGKGPEGLIFKGLFLFATREYGHDFQKNRLEGHYRNLFACLMNDTEKNSITSV